MQTSTLDTDRRPWPKRAKTDRHLFAWDWDGTGTGDVIRALRNGHGSA